MVYGIIISQNKKHVVSTKNMESIHLKYDERHNAYKIKAKMHGNEKITLGKYDDEEIAEFVFMNLIIFWGKDHRDYDPYYAEIMDEIELRKLFMSLEDNQTRFWMPEKRDINTYLERIIQKQEDDLNKGEDSIIPDIPPTPTFEPIKESEIYKWLEEKKHAEEKRKKSKIKHRDFFLFENRLSLGGKDESDFKPDTEEDKNG